MITIDLPWPPSVNHLYESRGYGGGKRLSAVARQYRCLVDMRVRDARRRGEIPAAALAGRLAVTIRVYAPTRARRDLDNLGKATLDSITHAKVWGDDEQIDYLTFSRAEVVKGGRITVGIEVMP